MGQLFSKKNKEIFSTPLGLNNPVTVQVLGICSALAVTAKLEPAIDVGKRRQFRVVIFQIIFLFLLIIIS